MDDNLWADAESWPDASLTENWNPFPDAAAPSMPPTGPRRLAWALERCSVDRLAASSDRLVGFARAMGANPGHPEHYLPAELLLDAVADSFGHRGLALAKDYLRDPGGPTPGMSSGRASLEVLAAMEPTAPMQALEHCRERLRRQTCDYVRDLRRALRHEYFPNAGHASGQDFLTVRGAVQDVFLAQANGPRAAAYRLSAAVADLVVDPGTGYARDLAQRLLPALGHRRPMDPLDVVLSAQPALTSADTRSVTEFDRRTAAQVRAASSAFDSMTVHLPAAVRRHVASQKESAPLKSPLLSSRFVAPTVGRHGSAMDARWQAGQSLAAATMRRSPMCVTPSMCAEPAHLVATRCRGAGLS